MLNIPKAHSRYRHKFGGCFPKYRSASLHVFGVVLLFLPSVLSQFCEPVPQPATLSYLHSLFTSGGTVRLCPDFTVSGQGCDTNEQPFQVLSSDLTVVCDLYRGGNRCEISCPGKHFEVNNGRTLVLEGMTLTGATSGSVKVNSGGYLISFDSTWEGNENVNGFGVGGAVYSTAQSIVYLVYCKFLGNIARGDGGALYVEGSLNLQSNIFEDNRALSGSGGALFAADGSSPLIRLSTFEGNIAEDRGPAIYSISQSVAAGNNGCGNVASFEICNGIFESSTNSCSDFQSTCNTPSEVPSLSTSMLPTSPPTLNRTTKPSTKPTTLLSISPSMHPTLKATFVPSFKASTAPSNMPSASPSMQASNIPTSLPSYYPTLIPTQSVAPSNMPSYLPSTYPSSVPTQSVAPSNMPSYLRSLHPTLNPSQYPTTNPSVLPSNEPSVYPTLSSSPSMSKQPSTTPSSLPSLLPSEEPSVFPTAQPSDSKAPSIYPTVYPSADPSKSPSFSPSNYPTNHPSVDPSHFPSFPPSQIPSSSVEPSVLPTILPSYRNAPSANPSSHPTTKRSSSPSVLPSLSQNPSASVYPTSLPTDQSTSSPSSLPSISRPNVFEPSFAP